MNLREKALAVAAKCYGNKLSEIEAVVLAFGKEVAEEAVKASRPKFKELAGTEVPADELAAAKKFADFDGKEQMMCGWQSVHREVHVLYHALLKAESRLAAFTSATPDSPEVKEALEWCEGGWSNKWNAKNAEVLARIVRAAQVRIQELEAKVSMNKSIADAALQRADESHGERADVLLRLSTETSNRVFTDSEMVKLEVRAESAESDLAAALARLAEAKSSLKTRTEERDSYLDAVKLSEAALAEAENARDAHAAEENHLESKLAAAEDFARKYCPPNLHEYMMRLEADLAAMTKERDEAMEMYRQSMPSMNKDLETCRQWLVEKEEKLATLTAALGRAREALEDIRADSCGLVHDGTECCLKEAGIESAIDDILVSLPPLPADAKGER